MSSLVNHSPIIGCVQDHHDHDRPEHGLQLGVDLAPLLFGVSEGEEAGHDGGRDHQVRAAVYPLNRVAAGISVDYIDTHYNEVFKLINKLKWI